MRARYRTLAAFVVALLALEARPAHAQDIDLCFATADRVAGGETVTDAEKEAGHKACQAALAATASNAEIADPRRRFRHRRTPVTEAELRFPHSPAKGRRGTSAELRRTTIARQAPKEGDYFDRLCFSRVTSKRMSAPSSQSF